MYRGMLSLALATLVAAPCLVRADDVEFTRTRDVVYGRKYGLALTMDVFAPKKDANGVGLISVVSGGWFSRPEDHRQRCSIQPFAATAATRFSPSCMAVSRSSRMPEIIQDMQSFGTLHPVSTPRNTPSIPSASASWAPRPAAICP